MKKDVFLIVVILFAFFSLDSDLDSPITEPHSSTLRFAAVGDLWMSGYPDQLALPNLVKNFNVDLILFLGDLNYECGARDTFKKNLDAWGQLFINNPDAPLDMRFSHKSDAVPILAVMGNHEVWKEDYLKQSPCRYPSAGGYRTSQETVPHVLGFTLPETIKGNERYYKYKQGPLEVFAINSWGQNVFNLAENPVESDGVSKDSIQAQNIKSWSESSTAPWQIAILHHPPFSSDDRDNSVMRWPFQNWGIDVVLAGHYHIFEAMRVTDPNSGLQNFPMVVNGAGGKDLSRPWRANPHSKLIYNKDFGVIIGEVTETSLKLSFYSLDGCANRQDCTNPKLIFQDEIKKPTISSDDIFLVIGSDKNVVFISGADFDADVSVFLDDVEVPEVTYISSSSLSFVVPEHYFPGTYKVTVYNKISRQKSNAISINIIPPFSQD